jgi:hypothetical protein
MVPLGLMGLIHVNLHVLPLPVPLTAAATCVAAQLNGIFTWKE